mgnify:CR=1 FL=1
MKIIFLCFALMASVCANADEVVDENDLLTYRVSAFSSEGEMLSKDP